MNQHSTLFLEGESVPGRVWWKYSLWSQLTREPSKTELFTGSEFWKHLKQRFPGGSVVNNLSANAGDVGSIPGSQRSLGEGNGNPLQYSCPDSMGRGKSHGQKSLTGYLQSMRSQIVGHDWTCMQNKDYFIGNIISKQWAQKAEFQFRPQVCNHGIQDSPEQITYLHAVRAISLSEDNICIFLLRLGLPRWLHGRKSAC